MKHTALKSLVMPVVLGLAILAAGCKGEEKAKPAAPPPPPPRPVERPPVAAPEPAPPPPAPPPRKERTGGKVVKTVATAQGKLNVVRYGKGSNAEYALMLGTRTLVDPEMRPIQVAATNPRSKPSLVLLRFPSKDKHCPAHFRVADVTRGKDPKVSEEFGNCSAKPKVSAASGGWKLAFPKAGSAKPRTWTYSKGELREAGQKGTLGPMGYSGPV
ncbi:MAG TPA: hypothetical protein VFR85_16120 [Anaeromyxobacteraceae bacterium]|nr:hypothetical protein [Anaeromyxobacteraceae bacterium]